MTRLFYALIASRPVGAEAELLDVVRDRMAALGLAPLAKATREDAWDLEAGICGLLREQGRDRLALGVEFGARLPPPTARDQPLPPGPQQRQEYLRSGRELKIPDDLLQQFLDRPRGADVHSILRSWHRRASGDGTEGGDARHGIGPGTGPAPSAERVRRHPWPEIKPDPLRMLFLAASPGVLSWIRFDREFRDIESALREVAPSGRYEIKQGLSVRVTDLQRALLHHRPRVVHFAGHGDPQRGIILENLSGGAQFLGSEALGQLFAMLDVSCVVLNACNTANQAEALAEHVDCAIGMTQQLWDATAVAFGSAFYRAIGFGENLKAAFDLGCNQIGLEKLEGIGGGGPRLFPRKGCDPAGMVLMPRAVPAGGES